VEAIRHADSDAQVMLRVRGAIRQAGAHVIDFRSAQSQGPSASDIEPAANLQRERRCAGFRPVGTSFRSRKGLRKRHKINTQMGKRKRGHQRRNLSAAGAFVLANEVNALVANLPATSYVPLVSSLRKPARKMNNTMADPMAGTIQIDRQSCGTPAAGCA